MPRVRWCRTCPLQALVLSLLLGAAWTAADCWYNSESHSEGTEVLTAEPCLNCTCSRGALLCYLRVCPRLPNPPPPGCILLHRYHTCCPELICPEVGSTNALEARSEPESFPLLDDSIKNACIVNGSIYGPGSALDSSTLCEYCYCLGGKETCVKPKCLLPVEGCVPMYETTSCCPVNYNCSSLSRVSSTTTSKPEKHEQGGCVVDGEHYREGGKVLGVGHSACDNCYCLRGILRCEPLSCAPPLLGCSPVVRPGECCAASYNCSGTIEIQPEPNYGLFPIVSKEYAKFRKEVQVVPRVNHAKPTETSNLPFYVIAESSATAKVSQRSPDTFGTTRHFTGIAVNPSSTVKPNEIEMSYNYYATTSFVKKIVSTPKSTEELNTISSERLRSGDYLSGLSDDSLLSIVDSLLDNRLNRRVENEIESTTTTQTEEPSTTAFSTEEPSTLFESTTEPITTESETVGVTSVTTILNSTDCIDGNSTQEVQYLTTTIPPVDANEINKLAYDGKNLEDYISTTSSEDLSTSSSTEETTDEEKEDSVTTGAGDLTEVDLESQVKVSSATVRSIPKTAGGEEIEAILNISKTKNQDYEYDYNEPSLPPSLPNLRIIPFVAADALDSKNEKTVGAGFERVGENNGFGYTNLFSPPVETEGGFIPKEPPILDNFYENGVTVPSITNTPNLHLKVNCLSEGQEVPHGASLPSDSSCITCSCYYGDVVCQNKPCSIPKPGCRKSTVQSIDSCCPHYICDAEEAPTVVLDRLENTSLDGTSSMATIADNVNTPDPFRDVIRTEPAPNLHSLIVDMMPFLAGRKTTPLSTSTSTTLSPSLMTTTTEKKNESESESEFSLDKVFELLFSQKEEEKKETSTESSVLRVVVSSTKSSSSFSPPEGRVEVVSSLPASSSSSTSSEMMKESGENESLHSNSVDSGGGGGGIAVLKLAGCNIYGRMYRVGRIISELSNACLECKCTEIGVQCRALKC